MWYKLNIWSINAFNLIHKKWPNRGLIILINIIGAHPWKFGNYEIKKFIKNWF